MSKEIVLQGLIESKILVIRGQRVMLDRDLAPLYGVVPKVLNQAVKRKKEKFPVDFMFQLSKREAEELSRSQFVTLKRGQNIKFLPYAFTEYGAIQAANILNSSAATQAGIAVVRAFVRLREMVSAHKELAVKLAELERRLAGHDMEIKAIVDLIRQLMNGMSQPENDKSSGSKKQIGFHPG
ncbi:MAG: ORF6N domain-containing protein [Elusimicrobia bacterium]|nr:ORF6N domain-containing protein [Elusimicrobiota bacterium]